MNCEVRPAEPGDLPALVELETATFDTDRLNRTRFAHHLLSSSADLLVADSLQGPIGYGLMLYRRGSNTARLYSLAVAPDNQGQGLATRLLDALLGAARQRQIHRIHLEVAESNVAARRLYQGLGGRVIRRLPGYYQNGQDAVRMVLPA